MSTFAYEALDRTHCTISSIQVNLIEHKFYDNCEEYKKLVDQATEILAKAYQVVGQWCAHELEEEEI
jgi:hypothetical protein